MTIFGKRLSDYVAFTCDGARRLKRKDLDAFVESL